MGQLVQDVCFRISVWRSSGPLVSGSCRHKISVAESFGPLYQDPIGALVQDLCFRISVWGSFGPLVSGSCRTTCTRSLYQDTCARSLYQDPVGSLLSGSCRTTSARSLSQDLCVRILLGHLHQDLVNEQILRDFLEKWRTGLPKGASYARLPRKLKIRSSKTSVLCETSPKTENPELQNERLMRDFLENWSSGLPKRAFCARLPRKLKSRTSKTSVLCETSTVLRLPRNHDLRSYEMLHLPRRLILKLKFQKCNHSQESSPSTSKHSIHGADSLRLSRKTQSFEWHTPANVLATSTKCCACHDFHQVSDSLHLPRKLTLRPSKTIRSPAPVT